MSQRTAGVPRLSLGRATPAGTPAAAILPVPKRLLDDPEFALSLALMIAQHGETATARRCGSLGANALRAGYRWQASCKGLCPAHAPRRRLKEIERVYEALRMLEQEPGDPVSFLTVAPSPELGSDVSQVESSLWVLEQAARAARQSGGAVVALSIPGTWSTDWSMTAIPHAHISLRNSAIPETREAVEAAIEGVSTPMLVGVDLLDDRPVTDAAGLASYSAQDLSVLPTLRSDGSVTMSRPAAMWQAAAHHQAGNLELAAYFAQSARSIGDAVRTRRKGPDLILFSRRSPQLITRSRDLEEALRQEARAQLRLDQRENLLEHRRALATHHTLATHLLPGLVTACHRLLNGMTSATGEPRQARARSPPALPARCPMSLDPILGPCPDRLSGAPGRRRAHSGSGNTETRSARYHDSGRCS